MNIVFANLCLLLTIAAYTPTEVYAQVSDTCLATNATGVKIYQSNYGITGYNIKQYIAGLIWPRVSQDQYIFAGGLWIGGKVIENGNTKPLVLVGYNPITGKSWCDPTTPIEVTSNSTSETIRSTFTDVDLSSYEGDTSVHRANGFPLHVVVSQTLTAWKSGQLRDVVTLQTRVLNTHPERTIYELVIANIFDIDIGTPIGSINAGKGDKCVPLQNRTDLGIFKAWSSPETDDGQLGVIGFAIINATADVGIFTAAHSFIFFVPDSNEERYAFITSGELASSTEGTDLLSVFATAPLDVGPSEEVQSTLVIMLGRYNDAANDQRMISIVDALKNGTSVNEVAATSQPFNVYPNPALGITSINIAADSLPTCITIVNMMGETVQTIYDPDRVVDISTLPTGYYTFIAPINGTPVASQVSVVK